MGPNAKFFKHDPAEAKKLLAAAGFPDGMKVDLISTPGYSQTFNQQVELVAAQLKKSGIDATIKMQEYAAYIGTTFAGKFPTENNTMVFGLETPFTEPHDFLFNMYHPKGTRNHAGVNDPKLTEMIEKQAKTLDKAERKKQIFEIQRYLGEHDVLPAERGQHTARPASRRTSATSSRAPTTASARRSSRSSGSTSRTSGESGVRRSGVTGRELASLTTRAPH